MKHVVFSNLVLTWLTITQVFENKEHKLALPVEFIKGIPQGSILGPLYFNSFFNDDSYLLKNLIYATLLTMKLLTCGDNLSVILKSLEYDM